MAYYDDKALMNNKIEEIIKVAKEGIEKDFLVYELTKTCKIGEKTVENRIKLLKKIGKISESGGVLAWKK